MPCAFTGVGSVVACSFAFVALGGFVAFLACVAFLGFVPCSFAVARCA